MPLSVHCQTAAAIALSAITFSASATTIDSVDISYLVPKVGVAIDYGSMGYTNADGSFVSLAGQQVLTSRVEVDFRPGRNVDWSTFHMTMVVPVSGTASQLFEVLASDLVKGKRGHYTYAFTTDLFNGTVYDGRFSVDAYGLDADGNTISLRGQMSATTGFYFTVALPTAPVPEPAAVWSMLCGLAFVPLVLRRSRRA